MKRLYLALMVVSVCVFGCQRIEELASVSFDGEWFNVTIEDDALAKTILDEHNNIRWSSEDQIVIFKKTTLGSKYQVKDMHVGKTSGSFSQVSSGSSGDDFSSGMYLEHNVAYYPYSETVECEKYEADYKLSINLPSEQTYASESFGNNTFPMVAVSETNNITFRNVCGGMKLLLKGTCMVTSIAVEGKNGEKLSGQAYVIAYTDDTKPVITMAENASTAATLNCGAGVQLNETDATEFILSLPPTIFTNGFAVTIMDSNGGTQVIETTKTNSILRSSLLVMPELTVQTIPAPQEGDYVDEYGVNHGQGVKIGTTVWAPVNCGYHETDYPFGKLYQWGRKYGQGYVGNIYDSEGEDVVGTHSDAYAPSVIAGGVSVEEGQKYENANIIYSGDSSTNYDWAYPSNHNLWNAGTAAEPIKTEYDPCPEGWRVPTLGELSRLKANSSGWISSFSGNRGFYFTGDQPYSSDKPQIYLCAAGYLSTVSGRGFFRGNEGNYWSSTTDGQYSRPLYFDGTYTIKTNSSVSRSNVFSVRCVQESKPAQ